MARVVPWVPALPLCLWPHGSVVRTPPLQAHLFFFPFFRVVMILSGSRLCMHMLLPFPGVFPLTRSDWMSFPLCKSLHFSFIFLSLNLGFPRSRTKTRIWEGIPAHLVRTWHREAGNGGEANHVLRGELRLWIIDPIPLVTL